MIATASSNNHYKHFEWAYGNWHNWQEIDIDISIGVNTSI